MSLLKEGIGSTGAKACSLIYLVALCAFTLVFTESVAALDNNGFSAASIRGSYASTGSNSGPGGTTGVIGVYSFDGKGTVRGITTHNQPDGKSKRGRKFRSFGGLKGKYNVDKSGRGTVVGLSNSRELEDMFIIVSTDDNGIATELFLILGDAGSATGSVRASRLVRQHPSRRIPFSQSSIKGTYALTAEHDGFTETAASLGVFDFDGKGIVEILVKINRPDGKGKREIFERKGKGRYWVGAGGRGRLVGTSGSRNLHDTFVITKSNDEGIATEIFVIYGDLSAIGALLTFKLTRQHP